MSDVNRLRMIIESLKAGRDNTETWADLDHEFHRVAINGTFQDVLDSIQMVETFIVDAQNQFQEDEANKSAS